MHIKISKSSLSEALNNVAIAVSAKTALPVLQNVKIKSKEGKAIFVCSDLDTTLVATADCETIADGATTIPVKTLTAAVNKLAEGMIEVEVDDKDVAKLTSGSSIFSFYGMPAKEFPAIEEGIGTSITLPCATIREMLRKTSFAMGVDDTRQILNAVLFDFTKGNGKAIAVATDGRRLSLLDSAIQISGDLPKPFALPRKAVDTLLKKLPKEGNCTLVSYGNQVKFDTPKLSLFTKLIDGEYPNYMQVIPSGYTQKIIVDRLELLGAIDRTSVFTSVATTPLMILTFSDNKIVISSGETEVGSSCDEVPIKYSGEKIEIRFNPNFVSDALNALDEDEIEIQLADAKSPAVIHRVGSDNYTYVVMPMRTA